ncbi:SDR family NAD(P)-dependent oxidoreductase (plasmid) [Rhizorhabdus wittichii]|uniref:SDR family NAD(P)-dependent oxidoreductase n=1 Tax=Rhizorhabdus wittichii TaxID=160791 RepID=A0A975D8M3_9SPHN|nr:SDR family NAD(P)-dependent oxidoreductase [Rhizorhabdus wittichii]QTH24982.1 SDR family NAD(P)-dependent oxidoreductase [Rhizorhabdus wittichii]
MTVIQKGKTAVITGGATGIGRALALGLADAGMNIVLASTSAERLALAADAVRERGAQVLVVPCDVSDRAAVRDLADRAVTEFGAVHLLCANAGVTTAGPFLNHGDEDWDWIYDVVLRGVTHCIQAFYPLMAKAGEGQILLTGSHAGLVPDWVLGHGPYTSAKSAVMALGAALRPEAAQHGVGVSILIPAGTESDILQSARSRPARYGTTANTGMSPTDMVPREGAPMPLADTKFFLTAEEVADIAIRALPDNPGFIATHPGLRPLVEDYFGRILAAY